MEPEYFENIVQGKVNELIKESLLEKSSWKINSDNLPIEVFNSIHGGSDGGMLLMSFHENDKQNNDCYDINLFANMILRFVLEESFVDHQHARVRRFSKIEKVRFLWNYYHGNSIGVEHQDDTRDNYYSIVYYLNTVENAGTWIKKEDGETVFAPSLAGSAVLFPSKLIHYGTAAKKNSVRLCLNILFKAEEC